MKRIKTYPSLAVGIMLGFQIHAVDSSMKFETAQIYKKQTRSSKNIDLFS